MIIGALRQLPSFNTFCDLCVFIYEHIHGCRCKQKVHDLNALYASFVSFRTLQSRLIWNQLSNFINYLFLMTQIIYTLRTIFLDHGLFLKWRHTIDWNKKRIFINM